MKRLLRQAASPMLRMPRLAKRLVAVTVDVCLCILATWAAFYLRLGELASLQREALPAVVASILIAIPLFTTGGLYRAIFRYAGWPAIQSVTRVMLLYSLLYATLVMAVGLEGTPRTVGLIQPLLLFFAVAGSRLAARFWLGGEYRTLRQRESLPRVMIYGAGSAGRQLAAALTGGYEFQVVGFFDDDDRLHGQTLNGVPIFAPKDLAELIETRRVSHVLLAMPSASRVRRNQILTDMSQHRVVVRTLPTMADLAEGRVTVSDIRDLDIDDLLGRDAVAPNYLLLAKKVTGRTVLVTGAGGSIGGELCRQVLALNPSQLLLVEVSEFALYAIHAELESMRSRFGVGAQVRIIPLLCSVQDGDRVWEIMSTWRPDTVYHAAAYKHVPLVEHNMAEGIKNNVFGTLTVVQAAVESGVDDCVLISTDKAVRPTNVMGASKRLAEMVLQAVHAKGANTTRLAMVRFGNVLASSGSVIPKFREQIRDGGPITVTHPEVNRFFMTIPEAAQLVIQAGALAKGGDVFVLDMGQPIKIIDLARRMVTLSGLRVRDATHPDGDIEIAITGLRPGEKLYEELLLGDDPEPTTHPKIQRARDAFIPWHQLEQDLTTLQTVANHNDVEVILSLLQKLVTGYQPNAAVVDWVFTEQVGWGNGTDDTPAPRPLDEP